MALPLCKSHSRLNNRRNLIPSSCVQSVPLTVTMSSLSYHHPLQTISRQCPVFLIFGSDDRADTLVWGCFEADFSDLLSVLTDMCRLQVEQQQQQHTESLFSAIPRHQQQQHLPVYPNQPAAASYQSAYHHQGWNQTGQTVCNDACPATQIVGHHLTACAVGGSVQHHQQDAPQAALYAAAAVTDARQPALDDQDLDIDKLLASLIAQ